MAINSGDTVILPLKARQYNPLSGREELMDTGMVAHYRSGKQVSEPFKMPTRAPVPQDVAVPSSALPGRQSFLRATISTPDNRPPAAHYTRPGETVEQAADRLAQAASRFEVRGNRASVTTDQFGRPFDVGHGGY